MAEGSQAVTEAASENDFGITAELCDIRTHPNAECFIAWTLEVTAAMVRARRPWASALGVGVAPLR
jgi:hypothetical protein